MVELLLANGASVDALAGGSQPIHGAAYAGHEGVVALLLERGASVDASFGRGIRPIDLAARAGRKDVAVLLLERGASVDDSARRLAAQAGHEGVVKLLENAEAKMQQRREAKRTGAEL